MDTENKEAFRSTVVFKLMDAHDLTVDEVIESAKKIEDYVYDFRKNCAEKQARNAFWPAR